MFSPLGRSFPIDERRMVVLGFGLETASRPRRMRRPMSPGRKLFLSLAMILAALWIYWPAMHGGWIWDDKTEIPKIAALGGPGLLHRIWVAPDTGDYYPVKVTVEW